jgi:Peptidase family M28
MLDPRIYRTGFVAVAVAVIVLAFSLNDQQPALSSSLAPDAFNGQNAASLASKLAAEYPQRRPGSPGDDALASQVRQTFSSYGFAVSTSAATARTADGKRTLETVTGTRPGTANGSIVIVAHRDALTGPAASDLSGTATLLELARVLSGETHNRSIVLASTSGSAGTAGATALANALGGVDAVIALGDIAAPRLHPLLIVPWSDSANVAPTALRNTLASALASQAALSPGGTSLAGQLAHLAFPLTLTEQGPFGTHGVPAVLLSATGERSTDPGAAPDLGRVTAFGRTVLQAINALDSNPSIPAAGAYLLYSGKVIPSWAVALLVLALIVPVLLTAVDGAARASRRGQPFLRWLVWVLLAALPFALAVLIARGVVLVGWLADAPAGPLAPAAVPLHAGGIVLLVGLGLVIAGCLWALSQLAPQRDRAGAGPVTLLVMCGCALAIWLTNPFAALLTVPALHLWMWVLDPDIRLRRPAVLAMLAVGLAAPLLVVAYYAVTLGYGPGGILWNGLLLIAGGHITLTVTIEWSVLLGCTVRLLAIAFRDLREFGTRQEAVTIRGPISYAGPGSLGGTESALRR